jgi:hypothetical protein
MKNIKFPIQTKLYWLRVLLKMKTKWFPSIRGWEGISWNW